MLDKPWIPTGIFIFKMSFKIYNLVQKGSPLEVSCITLLPRVVFFIELRSLLLSHIYFKDTSSAVAMIVERK